MNAMSPPERGHAPVGFLTELSPLEARAVMLLRLWCDGPEAQAMVSFDFAASLGQEKGRNALKSFATLCDLCVRHGRRPLLRHGVSCKCLGADESCFATFVGYASDGEREDALLMATTIVRPDMAPVLVGVAQDFGLALRQMALSSTQPHSNPTKLH